MSLINELHNGTATNEDVAIVLGWKKIEEHLEGRFSPVVSWSTNWGACEHTLPDWIGNSDISIGLIRNEDDCDLRIHLMDKFDRFEVSLWKNNERFYAESNVLTTALLEVYFTMKGLHL